MCVTNTTNRRPQPVAFNPQNVSLSQSLLSQRLFGSYLPTSFAVKQGSTNNVKIPTQFTSTVQQHEEKPRPKRRRKPQKPGKTAKNHDRHFVVHNYHDHALDPDEKEYEESTDDAQMRRRGGVSVAFPLKLHSVLDQVEADGLAHVVSWQGHGRAFLIHNPKEFVDHVMPRYFRQSKLTSFQRQLNLYGFARLTRGPDAGGYYHELFLRGKDFLCKKMTRTKVKGTMFKAASSPEQEPDFYSMPPVIVSPSNSDDDSSYQVNSIQKNESEVMTTISNINYDPVPLSFAQIPYNEPQNRYYSQTQLSNALMASSNAAACFVNGVSIPSNADRILDEAVDELFLQQEEVDNLDEFVHDWDPSFDEAVNGVGIEDDSQLGYLLEKLLG